jgi:hypothetical protein
MISSAFFSVCFLSTLFVSTQAYSGSLALQVLQKRATYNGGWPLGLSGPTCPSEAPVPCQDTAKAVNPTCCPTGQTCFGFLSPYCCPTGTLSFYFLFSNSRPEIIPINSNSFSKITEKIADENLFNERIDTDCSNVVTNVPVCANSTWNMYQMASTIYICCEPGTVGVIPIAGYAGMCEPLDADTPTSRLATLASQIGGPAITGVATATGGNTASPTTAAGKGQTTVTSAPSTGGASTSAPAATSTSTAGSGSLSGNTSSGQPLKTVLGKNHLSTGEIVGIAVGGAAILGLIAAFIVCCCRQKRHQEEYTQPSDKSTAYKGSGIQASGYSVEPLYAPVPNSYAPYTAQTTEYQTPPNVAREQMRSELGHDEI